MLYDDDLLHGDPQQVADYLGISARTLRRYKAAPDKMPDCVKKLLRLRRAIGGDGWEGFYLQAGGLFCSFWERSIKPETIKGWFF